MTTLDPVTLAVLKGRLEQIADEMDATLYRSAFNPIIAEARDACHGLYHAETGATLVQGSTGLPIFVGAMAFAVKAVIDKVARDEASGRDQLKPGDTFLFNDPYDGGTHLNDFRLVRPVHRDGKLFCWIASVGHWLDIGGNVPGGFNARATECYQEGVRIPPGQIHPRRAGSTRTSSTSSPPTAARRAPTTAISTASSMRWRSASEDWPSCSTNMATRRSLRPSPHSRAAPRR